MPTRRGVLKASLAGLGFGGLGFGGLGFCGCGLGPGRAFAATTHRLPVMVAGKRVRTVDMHGHCYFQDAIDLMGADAKTVLPPVKGVPEHFLASDDVLKTRIAMLDAAGIDLQVCSINPFWYGRDIETAEKIVSLQNTHMAEIRAAHPDRFQFYASLTLQDPDRAVAQLDDAVRNKKLVGAAVGSSMLGESFANERFHKVWAKAVELDAVIFIHPQSQPQLAARYAGNGWLSNTIGNPLDTTICLEHFIMEGVLDKFPTLKLLAAHGGGYFGLFPDRGDYACNVSPQNCNPAIVLKKTAAEYARQIHYDAMVFTPENLRHLVANVGASQIVLGSDSPIPWEEHPVDRIFAARMLSDAEKTAILGGNAARLMKTKS